MAEHDLRMAFDHLKEDVMNNVRTERRLDQITQRRTLVRPAVTAFAGAAAVVLVVGAALLALRPGGTADIPPAIGPTTPPTTLVGTTVPSSTTTPTQMSDGLDLTDETWVLHGLEGISTSSSGAVVWQTAPIAAGPNLARDHIGGIAFSDTAGLWWWRAGDSEPRLVLEDAVGSLLEVIPTTSGPVARLSEFVSERFVSLDTGEDVDLITGSVVATSDGVQTRRAANGLTVTVAQPEVTRDGEGAVAGVGEPAHLIVESDGTVRLDARVGTAEEPWARLHDFDGRHVIVSRGPIEPALPPETYLVIDLACADCTGTFVEAAATAALTGPDVDWDGPIADFGSAIAPEATPTAAPGALPGLTLGTTVIADPTAPASGSVAVDTTTVRVGADVAVGDGSGGLFVQSRGNIEWWPAEGVGTIQLDPTFTGAPDETVELRLQDVTVIDGKVNVIFIVAGGNGEQRYEEVWRYEVATAAPTMVYHTGAFEGTIRRASLQNGILAVTRHAEGFTWFEFFDAAGQPVGVHNPKPDGGGLPLFVDQGVLSTDGTTFAYLESDTPPTDGSDWSVNVVVWDLTNGAEDHRMEVDLGDWYPDRVDYNGSQIVVGRVPWNGDPSEAGAPLLVSFGTVTELDAAGLPSLIKLDSR